MSRFVMKKLADFAGTTRFILNSNNKLQYAQAVAYDFLCDKPKVTMTSNLFDRFSSTRTGLELLNKIPHTLIRTTKVTSAKHQEEDADQKVLSAQDHKFCLSVPGAERAGYTTDGLTVYIDLGLNPKLKLDDFDERSVDTQWDQLPHVLSIKGFLQKHNIRRSYSARVNLFRDHATRLLWGPIETELWNGNLAVTIPFEKKKNNSD